MVEIAGYRIYPLFWILLIGIPLLILIIIKIFLSLRTKKTLREYNRITNWQRENLPKLINRAIKAMTDEQEIEVLKKSKKIIIESKFWDSDKFLAIQGNCLYLLNLALYSEFIQLYFVEKRIEDSTYILHALDALNDGLLDADSPKFEWIGEDIQGYEMFEGMDVYEDRMAGIWADSVLSAQKKVDPDLMKIPRSISVFEELYNFYDDDYNEVVADIANSDNPFNLEDRSYEVIISCLVDKINNFVGGGKDREKLIYIHIYYIRSLICAIERENYIDLLGFFKKQ